MLTAVCLSILYYMILISHVNNNRFGLASTTTKQWYTQRLGVMHLAHTQSFIRVSIRR